MVLRADNPDTNEPWADVGQPWDVIQGGDEPWADVLQGGPNLAGPAAGGGAHDCPEGYQFVYSGVGQEGSCQPSGQRGPESGGGGDGGGGDMASWLKLFQSLSKPSAASIPGKLTWNPQDDPLWNTLNEGISSALQGKTTFDKDTIERLKGAARVRSENLRDQSLTATRSGLTRRGILSSPIGSAIEAETNRAADQDYASTASGIEVQAQIQNYKDRQTALDRAERLLNQQTQYVLAQANNDLARANLLLQYRRIDEARDALDKQLAAQLYGQQAGFNFQNDYFNMTLPFNIWQTMQQNPA